MYVEMLFEYMQRRTELENEAFNTIVEQSNEEEMTTTFKTIFETAREEGEAAGFEKGINIGEAKGLEQGLEQGLERGLEQGLEQGLSIGDTKAVKALVKTTQLSDDEISKELEVSVDFVKMIRKELDVLNK